MDPLQARPLATSRGVGASWAEGIDSHDYWKGQVLGIEILEAAFWWRKHQREHPVGCFLKWWYPRIIHFNRVFHYNPSILGYPYFWKPPVEVGRWNPLIENDVFFFFRTIHPTRWLFGNGISEPSTIAMENGPGLKMYFLWNMMMIQPAMLVYQRVAEFHRISTWIVCLWK